MRRTKIVATLGPATNEVDIIKDLITAGMDAARINFSHGTYESHKEVIGKLKQAREELNAPVSLMLDTKGPEIRIGVFKKNAEGNEVVYLSQGSTFTLTTRDIEGDESIVSVTYKQLPGDLEKGSKVLIDDGLIELKVKSIKDTEIICEVINAGFLSSRKGVNVPDVYVNLPSLTEKDIEDIKFGIEQGFDFIAASFIRSAKDVIKIRDVLESNGGEHVRIISKIESRDGVNNIESILEVSDGLMVARGDLGVEIPPEEVPLVQKKLIKSANFVGKPVITATQMLESMVDNPRPTRAEANDVANAILDGSDAIMLSGETAKGKYPVESIEMMARIASTTEKSIDYINEIGSHHYYFKTNITNAISYAACTTAMDLHASCILTITNSGITSRMVSKFRPDCPILAITKSKIVWRQLNLSWGCYPKLMDNITNESAFPKAIDLAVIDGIAKQGDYVVLCAGVPVGVSGSTNLLKVEMVGDVLLKGVGIGIKSVSGITKVIRAVDQPDQPFVKGEILVAPRTTDELLPYIRKAGGVIVGSDLTEDYTHAITVCKALDIPLIIADQKVIDVFQTGSQVTIDSKNGFVYNGKKL